MLTALAMSLVLAAPVSPPPALAKEAKAFSDRLIRTGAIWDVLIKTGDQGGVVRTNVLFRPPNTRWTFWQGDTLLAAVIEKGATWYTWQPAFKVGWKSGPKWRLSLEIPTLYALLAQSQLRVVGEDAAKTARDLEPRLDRVKLVLTHPIEPPPEQVTFTPLTGVPALVPLEIDARTGLVWRSGDRWQLDEFEWDVSPDEAGAFNVVKAEPVAPLPKKRDNLMLINLCGAVAKLGDCAGDPHLLDVVTGELWRVPVPMGEAIGGSLSADKAAAFVSYATPAGIKPFEVDLDTGAVRAPWNDTVQGAAAMFPRVSHSGTRLALLASAPGSSAPGSALWVVDRATGAGKQLSKPMDLAFASWLPDDSGLLLVRRQDGKEMVCRVSLEGELTELFEGSHPALLSAERVLYRDVITKEWWTRRLDGGDAVRFGDGLVDATDPAPVGDGTHAVFLKRVKGQPNLRPVVATVTAKGVTTRAIPTRAGLFSWPTF